MEYDIIEIIQKPRWGLLRRIAASSGAQGAEGENQQLDEEGKEPHDEETENDRRFVHAACAAADDRAGQKRNAESDYVFAG